MAEKLSGAIDYIENNLDKEISCGEAARIACCSPFYFQRLFSYVSGISLSEYIRRREMIRAAFELQRTGAKVIDVALKYGYAGLPDIEVYPICQDVPAGGHSEVRIAIKKKQKEDTSCCI